MKKAVFYFLLLSSTVVCAEEREIVYSNIVTRSYVQSVTDNVPKIADFWTGVAIYKTGSTCMKISQKLISFKKVGIVEIPAIEVKKEIIVDC